MMIYCVEIRSARMIWREVPVKGQLYGVRSLETEYVTDEIQIEADNPEQARKLAEMHYHDHQIRDIREETDKEALENFTKFV